MRYKYHLTKEQYETIWTSWTNPHISDHDNGSSAAIKDRKILWRTNFQKKFKLSYSELPPDYNNNDNINSNFHSPGHWGTVTGSKKSINWFLLHL